MKRLRVDPILLFSVIFVAIAGIATLYAQEAILDDGPGRWQKQLIYFIIGLVLMLIFRRANYQILSTHAIWIYGISIFLLVITLIPFIGAEIKGSRAWIRLGPVNLQTSEIAKLAVIILLARYLEVKEKEMERIPSLIIPSLVAIVPMLLIVVQPDLGYAVTIAAVVFTLLFIAGADIYHLGSVVVFLAISILVPLYLEYHDINLVDPLLAHLSELERNDLLPAVRILRNEVWEFIDQQIIPSGVTGSDLEYLHNIMNSPVMMAELADAVFTVRYAGGGLLLRILDSDLFLAVSGTILTITAAVLAIIRFSQGRAMAHLRRWYIPFGVIGLSLLAALTVHLTFSIKYHQVVRVTAFISPEKFPRDLAYQTRASKAAIGSGQFTGRGFDQGDMTIGERPLVPEAFTDFIFTGWAERTGFIGSVVLLLLLLAIPIRAIQLSFEARDRFGSYLAAGIGFLFFYHIFFNLGIALGLMPVTGLPLSFMSYGGSHMVTSMIAIGILLSIHRRRFAN